MTPLQRALFAFTTMVTVAHVADLILGIQNLYSTVIIAVTVWSLFYVRVHPRGGQGDHDQRSSSK